MFSSFLLVLYLIFQMASERPNYNGPFGKFKELFL